MAVDYRHVPAGCDPGLDALYRALKNRAGARLLEARPPDRVPGIRQMHLRMGGTPRTRAKPDRVQVLVFGPGGLRSKAAGIIINPSDREIQTAYLDVVALRRLVDMEGVRAVVPSYRVYSRMDVAVRAPRLDGIRQRFNEDGTGVLIGIIDSGVDGQHEAFRGRMVRIWDQVQHGEGVQEANYGKELTAADAVDLDGHGTHVAGVAAGAQAPFRGVAPGAELAVVRTGARDGEVIDGLRYLRRVAESLGKPCVVNLSFGSHNCPHDGSSPLSQAINDEVGRGFVVCCAAGNEGDSAIHSTLTLEPEQSREVRFRIPITPQGLGEVHLVIFVEGRDAAVSVGLNAPARSGGRSTPMFEALNGRAVHRYRSMLVGHSRFLLHLPDSTGRRRIVVDVLPGNAGVIHPGPWTLKLKNDSRAPKTVRMWSLEHDAGPAAELIDFATEGFRVGTPGTSSRAITVGAWSSRLEWDADAGHQQLPGHLNGVSAFSSPGPRVDGIPKPEFVAPGEWVVAARSRDQVIEPELVVADKFAVARGTSQATAFLSGVVALILAREPTFTPEQVKMTLEQRLAPLGAAYGPIRGFGPIVHS